MKRTICYLEISILIISMFAFSYALDTEKGKIEFGILDFILEKIRAPMLPLVSADVASVTPAENNVCCERTNYGAWCQNAPESQCDSNFRKNPTSCDATSFCRQGCCYDSSRGVCSENTPQLVCQESNGTWADSATCDIPQCELGCCVLGNQAAFVTLTRCKKLNSFFGLTTDFRRNIATESECIAVTQTQDRGACVYEEDFIRTCKFTTRQDCNSMEGQSIGGVTFVGNFTFYKDYLCSAEELGTNCGPTQETTCVAGKDEVYFLDSCGNPANIYDYSKINNKEYWKKIVDKGLSCGSSSSIGNANSAACGNCDYFSGSFCREFDSSKDRNRPSAGDYICRDLNCKDTSDGRDYKHGESWCIYDSATGQGQDLAGSREWKHVCIAGEELVEPCADFRQETCIQDAISTSSGDFQQAACRVNRWQDCLAQKEKDDCLNQDKRDCQWIEGVIGDDNFGNSSATNNLEEEDEEVKELKEHGVCAPDTPPGLDFWSEGGAAGTCSQGSAVCIVGYEKGLLGEEECVTNCECLESSWYEKRQEVCRALGDCSGKQCEDGECQAKQGVYTVLGSGRTLSGTGLSRMLAVFANFLGMIVGLPGVSAAPSVLPAAGGAGKVAASFQSISGQGTLTEALARQAGGYQTATGLGGANYGGGAVPYTLTQSYQNGQLVYTANYQAVGSSSAWSQTLTPGQAKILAQGAGTNLESSSAFAMNNYLSTSTAKLGGLTAGQQLPGGVGTVQSVVTNADGTVTATLSDAAGKTQTITGGAQETVGSITQKAATPQGNSWLSQMFSATGGGALDAVLTGLQWGAVAFGIGYLIGTFFGMSDNNTMALALSLGGGTFIWQSLNTFNWAANGLAQYSWLGTYSFPIGLGVAALIFVLMYKDTDTERIEFECLPYEAPTGGAFCELCNNDKFRPCSDYRCKSLGQACQLLNAGTDDQKCAWVNPKDVKSPGIKKLDSVLIQGYVYADYRERPEGGGVQPGRYSIKRTEASDGCVKAFTPLTFGINTTEPAQCKVDYNTTTNVRDVKQAYEAMSYYFGGSNLYTYEHSQTLRLPGSSVLNDLNASELPEIGIDGTFTFYVRCKDANGNINEDEFSIRFCVEKGPDTTPPNIEGTSIPNNMPISFNTNETRLEVYVNEPANCRWSKEDKDYDLMEHSMTCDTNSWNINNNMLYKCLTTLTGLENRKDNIFYFRCKDQPDKPEDERFENTQSYAFTLKGSQPLNILSVKPNGTLEGYSNNVAIELEIETGNGFNEGDAVCYYSQQNIESSYIKMFETGTNLHKQRQDLPEGNYTYYFKCVDLGGNADYNSTTFSVNVDREAPQVVRIYNEGGNLRVETDEKSTCYYSENLNLGCNYVLESGTPLLYQNATTHYTEWKANTNLYLKCKDSNGNQPNPTDCSIVVRPYNFREPESSS